MDDQLCLDLCAFEPTIPPGTSPENTAYQQLLAYAAEWGHLQRCLGTLLRDDDGPITSLEDGYSIAILQIREIIVVKGFVKVQNELNKMRRRAVVKAWKRMIRRAAQSRGGGPTTIVSNEPKSTALDTAKNMLGEEMANRSWNKVTAWAGERGWVVEFPEEEA